MELLKYKQASNPNTIMGVYKRIQESTEEVSNLSSKMK